MLNGGPIRVAVVGAGVFGSRRARVAAKDPHSKVSVIVDSIPEQARRVASEVGCEYATDWKRAVTREDVDVVMSLRPPAISL